jgi:hypothetical protein
MEKIAILRNLIIYILQQLLLGQSDEEGWTGGTCSMHGEMRNT